MAPQAPLLPGWPQGWPWLSERITTSHRWRPRIHASLPPREGCRQPGAHPVHDMSGQLPVWRGLACLRSCEPWVGPRRRGVLCLLRAAPSCRARVCTRRTRLAVFRHRRPTRLAARPACARRLAACAAIPGASVITVTCASPGLARSGCLATPGVHKLDESRSPTGGPFWSLPCHVAPTPTRWRRWLCDVAPTAPTAPRPVTCPCNRPLVSPPRRDEKRRRARRPGVATWCDERHAERGDTAPVVGRRV